jgi:hypothetical protein
MLTNSLIRVFFAPVVVQSLAVFELKPKMGLQTCLFVLTQTMQAVKFPEFQNELVLLILGNQISSKTHKFLYQS